MKSTVFRYLQIMFGICICAGWMAATLHAQSPANYGQQIAVLKTLNADLKSVGVLGSTLSDQQIQDLTRAGLGQGVQVVIGRPKTARDISDIYKKLVREKSVQVIIIPDASDELMVGVGFEYLKSNALPDKVGLCVPLSNLVGAGALCSVQREGGKITAYVNTRVCSVLGTSIPSVEGSPIKYVAQ